MEGGGRLVLGLGNPGERYAATRHNLGFRVVDELARRLRVAVDRRECDALVGEAGGGAAGEARPLLAKPQTYMNRSGFAARCLVERRGLAPGDLLVVYDEVALPLGRVRVRPGGGPAGHRGIESVIAELRTDEVARVRLGIAPEEPPADLVGFVLAPFAAGEEEAAAAAMVALAADACQAWLVEGVAAAMNRFNGLS
ncbi:MAG TPA: aminoacyl-tRNA hydrolase [Thermoanaerobaculia bacterium]